LRLLVGPRFPAAGRRLFLARALRILAAARTATALVRLSRSRLAAVALARFRFLPAARRALLGLIVLLHRALLLAAGTGGPRLRLTAALIPVRLRLPRSLFGRGALLAAGAGRGVVRFGRFGFRAFARLPGAGRRLWLAARWGFRLLAAVRRGSLLGSIFRGRARGGLLPALILRLRAAARRSGSVLSRTVGGLLHVVHRLLERLAVVKRFGRLTCSAVGAGARVRALGAAALRSTVACLARRAAASALAAGAAAVRRVSAARHIAAGRRAVRAALTGGRIRVFPRTAGLRRLTGVAALWSAAGVTRAAGRLLGIPTLLLTAGFRSWLAGRGRLGIAVGRRSVRLPALTVGLGTGAGLCRRGLLLLVAAFVRSRRRCRARDDQRDLPRLDHVRLRRPGDRRRAIVLRHSPTLGLRTGPQANCPGREIEGRDLLTLAACRILQQVPRQHLTRAGGGPQADRRQPVIGIDRADFDLLPAVFRDLHAVLYRRQDFDLRRQIAQHVDAVQHRLRIALAAGRSEPQLVRTVLRLQPLVVQLADERTPRFLAAKLHLDPVGRRGQGALCQAPVGDAGRLPGNFRGRIKFQDGGGNRLVRAGPHRDPRALCRLDVALPLNDPLGQPRVRRRLVLDGFHEDHRRGDHAHLVSRGPRVSCLDPVRQISLDALCIGRQAAFVTQEPGSGLHLRRLQAQLFVLRGVADRHRLVAAQVVAVSGDNDPLALKDLHVSGLHVLDAHAAGAGDVGPGREDPRDALERTLGGQDRVRGANREHAGQKVANPDQPRPIHRGIDGHVVQVGRCALLQRLVNDRPHAGAIRAEQQEVDQTVFERGIALFDRACRKQRIHAAQQHGQHHQDQVAPGAAGQQHQRRPTSCRAQRHHPVIEHRDNQQKAQDPGAQHHERTAQVEQLDLSAGPFDLPVDKAVVTGAVARRGRGSQGFGGCAAGRHGPLAYSVRGPPLLVIIAERRLQGATFATTTPRLGWPDFGGRWASYRFLWRWHPNPWENRWADASPLA